MQYTSYIIEVLLISAVFFLGYRLLKGRSSFRSLRIYLLISIISIISLPLITIDLPSNNGLVPSQVTETLKIFPLEEAATLEEAKPQKSQSTPVSGSLSAFSLNWLLVLFVTGMIVMGVRFLYGLGKILALKSSSTPVSSHFETSNLKQPGASFFRWVFIDKTICNEEKDVVLRHEQTHVRLVHSADKLVAELATIFLWWNPFVWYFKREISHNAEYEVDEILTRTVDKKSYAVLLLSSLESSIPSTLLNHFAISQIEERIKTLSRNSKRSNAAIYSSTFILLILFFVISCRMEDQPVLTQDFSGIKSIKSHFVSHQGDTQQKDGKTIATAHFLPDGTLDKYTQHMTYPYDYVHEKSRSFWANPDPSNLSFIMDGLDLNEAENQLLYGSRWPSLHAQALLESNESSDRFRERYVMTVDNWEKPTLIQFDSKWEERLNGEVMKRVTKFEYDGDLVLVHKKEYRPMASEDKKTIESMTGTVVSKVEFSYDHESRISSVKDLKGAEHHFFYEEGLLVKSEFLVRDKKYHTRYYFYEEGLNTRTEIYNTYDQKEYTILYDYEYYEEG